jgi:membrane-bound lytic murein transglycosylase B
MTRSALLACLCLLVSVAPARAELVFFASGRSVSVKGHHADGDSLVLTLRGGGQIVCAPSMIARIEPDEVAYPESPEALAEPDSTERPAAELFADARAGRGGPVPFSQDLEWDPRYAPIIEKAAAAQGVDPKLVRALIQVESHYESRARSPRGAMGLMQLMPATARRYAVADPYDPASNIEAGIKHLKSLLERFTEELALAAYNAGESAVQRFRGVPPYPETRSYVDRILRLAGRS